MINNRRLCLYCENPVCNSLFLVRPSVALGFTSGRTSYAKTQSSQRSKPMSAKMSSAYKAAHILVERVRVLKALCQESAGNAIWAVTMNGFSPKSGF